MYRYVTLIKLHTGVHLPVMYVGGAVSVTSCGPLVHSSACTLCVLCDGLFVSTGRETPSAVLTHACTPIVLSPSLGIPWTCGTCGVSTGPFS